jgi:antitoxin (DNA-binding transcriptional repressor) of toxin-antitoxin stability system
MLTVGLTEAKRRFEELVERAVQGERIRITKYGKPKAEMVRAQANRQKPRVSEKAGKHSQK